MTCMFFLLSKTLANVIPEMNRWDLQNKMPALGTRRRHVQGCATGCRQSQGDVDRSQEIGVGLVSSELDLGSDSTL